MASVSLVGWPGSDLLAAARSQLQQQQQGSRSQSPMSRVILMSPSLEGSEEGVAVHTVTVERSEDGKLGFSVRGGAEHGLGIFVSKVEGGSSAGRGGLCVGDKLMEVNGVSMEGASMSSAVTVLMGSVRMRLLVRRLGKVPGVLCSKEQTTWVDLIHRRMVVEDSDHPYSQTSGPDGALRRIIHIYTTPDNCYLGFNIRGGSDFSLGIYISSLDPGGLAEQSGIKIGDQILSANGVSFENISHERAVEVLRSQYHVMLSIREAGRYPAFKEIVAEYGWLDRAVANGVGPSSNRGSDSVSIISSLSSATPLSSLSSHSLAYSARSAASTSTATTTHIKRVEIAVQTDPTEYRPPEHHASPKPTRSDAGDTSRSLGATIFLKDTAIRGVARGGALSRSSTFSMARDSLEEAVDSRKAAVLKALSRPRQPLRRSQSHMATSDSKKIKQQEKGKQEEEAKPGAMRRSKTFVSLLFKGALRRDGSRGRSSSRSKPEKKSRSRSRKHGKSWGRSRSPSLNTRALQEVETVAQKLLVEDEASAVMRHCRRFVTERVMEDLVRPLLALLDRPEKLLLLREIRMIVPPSDLAQFDRMVAPFVEEAYESLKSRLGSPSSSETTQRSPRFAVPRTSHSSRPPRRQLITLVPDSTGGFQLHPARSETREAEKPQPGPPQTAEPHTAMIFTPLVDVSVDSPSDPRPVSPSPFGRSPRRRDSSASCSASSRARFSKERGRSPFRSRRDTVRVVDTGTPRGPSPRLSAAPPRPRNGYSQECELIAVSISKAHHSLGISISGGSESQVQPVVKIEEIFPGGAAATSSTLRAGLELASVDGQSLQGVTHQQAVHAVRKAFSNKAKDPMVFVVKVPR